MKISLVRAWLSGCMCLYNYLSNATWALVVNCTVVSLDSDDLTSPVNPSQQATSSARSSCTVPLFHTVTTAFTPSPQIFSRSCIQFLVCMASKVSI